MLHCNQQMPNEVYLYLVRTTICRTTLNIETEQVAIVNIAPEARSSRRTRRSSTIKREPPVGRKSRMYFPARIRFVEMGDQ